MALPLRELCEVSVSPNGGGMEVIMRNRIKGYIRKGCTRASLIAMDYKFLLGILIISWACTCIIRVHAANDTSLQEGIAEEVIRFHVIANSDSTEDQQLKLKVKEELVKKLSPKLKDITDIAKGRAVIEAELPAIRAAAEQIITEQGYSYPVLVSLESVYFPMKQYGDYTFPPGNYEALRVQIGKATGKNWWCVMFPPLCFVDETYSIVDPEAEDQLKVLLTEEEYDVLKDKKVPVKYKSKLWGSIKKLFS